MRFCCFVAALALVAGCGKRIGDQCKSNVDCSLAGDRFCDVSAPSGYCTVEGCDSNTCPDEGTCVRFFTPQRNVECTYDPDRPNSRGLASNQCPNSDDRCVCDEIDSSGACSNGLGHCAPESSERRWCQLKCDDTSDCRAGYECRSTGTHGAEPVPTLTSPTGTPAKFCAPRGA